MRVRLAFAVGVVLALSLAALRIISNDPQVATGDTANAQAIVMTSIWNEPTGELRIFRDGQIVVVYQRDTQNSVRSIANSITELYAVGHPGENLVRNDSPLVPPQILVGVKDDLIGDTCSNDPNNNSCDYFAHHNPTVEVVQASGSAVRFRVRTTGATQHYDQGIPIAYASDMTITVPFHQELVVLEYDVHTSLQQPVNVRHALRPLPFLELVNNPYATVAYLHTNCQDVATTTIPTAGGTFLTFLQQWPVCNDRPWAAIYHNDKGNLGMSLRSWEWSSGSPELVAFTETVNHPQKPNLYFQSHNHSRRYDTGSWNGHIVFLVYTNATDHTPVQKLRNMLKVYLPAILKDAN